MGGQLVTEALSKGTVITAKYDVTHKYKVSYEADDVLVGMEYIANKDKPKDVPDAPEKGQLQICQMAD